MKPSHYRNGATVNDVFCSRNRGGTRRSEKRDEICHLSRLGRATDRDAAERIHQTFAGTLVINSLVGRQLGDQTHGCFGFNPARDTWTTRTPLGLTSLDSPLL